MKNDKITISHGSGGLMTRRLVKDVFIRRFGDDSFRDLPDSAILRPGSPDMEICFTTDSYVVSPLFFPGGDIGKLSICGTINDLAVAGAVPAYISCGFVIEEGFRIDLLARIAESMARTARSAGVRVVTGDTKVVEKGKADGVFINTSGIGFRKKTRRPGIEHIKPGDSVILSGVPGEHELAILTARENLGFKSTIKSDCAALNRIVDDIFKTSKKVKFLRDATRGGVAAVLNEIVENAGFGISVNEARVPLNECVKSLCEILGFDPLYLANEGKIVIVADSGDAERIVSRMRRNALGREAAIIGSVTGEFRGVVVMKTILGSSRIIDMPAGTQLPRIC